jgi:hypothetical protein
MRVARRWPLAEMQWAFPIFIATETWLTPAAGAIVDRFGPRRRPSRMIAAGGVLVGPGWVINAYADTLPIIYWRRDHRHRRRRDLCRLRRQRGEMVSRSPRPHGRA